MRLDDDDDDGGGGSTPGLDVMAVCVSIHNINILFRELIHLATQYFISDNYLAPSTPLSSSCISQRNEWPRNYTQNRLPPLEAPK